MAIATIGIDLGKNSCRLAGLDATGAVALRRRLVAGQARRVPEPPPAVRGGEGGASRGARRLGRVFVAQGRAARLMAPEYVQPCVKAQKNDDRDAEAIAEAATRPSLRFASPKAEAQLDQQTLRRARSRLVNSRTRLMNQLRAIRLEPGVTVAKGRRARSRARGSARRRGLGVGSADV